MDIHEYIKAHGLYLHAIRVPARTSTPDQWDRAASHYHCTIIKAQPQADDGLEGMGRDEAIRAVQLGKPHLVTFYSQGSAIKERPKLAGVLSSLAQDATGVDGVAFESWASEYGYETDSRAAYATYEACRAIAADLRKLLGDTALEALLYNTRLDD